MKTKHLSLLAVLLLTSACGKKVINESGFIGGTSSNNEASSKEVRALEDEKVDDQTCIDDKLNKDLDSGETIAKLMVNNDLTFCNGVRVRLKAYLFASKKYKAYGYLISNSGAKTCIHESDNFTHAKKLFINLGEQGVLEGNDGMKLLLGGHSFDSNKELVPSTQHLARFVKFNEWGTYTGEMAIYEKDKVRCWAIQ